MKNKLILAGAFATTVAVAAFGENPVQAATKTADEPAATTTKASGQSQEEIQNTYQAAKSAQAQTKASVAEAKQTATVADATAQAAQAKVATATQAVNVAQTTKQAATAANIAAAKQDAAAAQTKQTTAQAEVTAAQAKVDQDTNTSTAAKTTTDTAQQALTTAQTQQKAADQTLAATQSAADPAAAKAAVDAAKAVVATKQTAVASAQTDLTTASATKQAADESVAKTASALTEAKGKEATAKQAVAAADDAMAEAQANGDVDQDVTKVMDIDLASEGITVKAMPIAKKALADILANGASMSTDDKNAAINALEAGIAINYVPTETDWSTDITEINPYNDDLHGNGWLDGMVMSGTFDATYPKNLMVAVINEVRNQLGLPDAVVYTRQSGLSKVATSEVGSWDDIDGQLPSRAADGTLYQQTDGHDNMIKITENGEVYLTNQTSYNLAIFKKDILDHLGLYFGLSAISKANFEVEYADDNIEIVPGDSPTNPVALAAILGLDYPNKEVAIDLNLQNDIEEQPGTLTEGPALSTVYIPTSGTMISTNTEPKLDVDAAKQTQQALTKAYVDATYQTASAQKAADAAKAAQAAAIAAISTKQAALTAAQQALAVAKQTEADAQKVYEVSIADPAAKQAAIAEAQAVAQKAAQAVTVAQADLAAAQAAQQQADATLTKDQTALTKAQAQLLATQQAATAANAKVAALVNADENLAAAQATLLAAQTTLTTAQAAAEDAQKALVLAQADLAAKTAALKQATSKLAEVKQQQLVEQVAATHEQLKASSMTTQQHTPTAAVKTMPHTGENSAAATTMVGAFVALLASLGLAADPRKRRQG